MLEHELFPTPIPVIEKMLEPYIGIYDRDTRYGPKTYRFLRFDGLILEPHGGSGAILDYLSDKLDIQKRKLVTIELDLELRFLLQGKGYKVIGSDFLEYEEPTEFGLILANPPFSNGVKHALKIWSVLAPEGKAAILLNRETIDNPCSKDRENLKALIDEHGYVEYLGQCFQDSERPTDVEVALVRLEKPAKNTTISFDDLNLESDGGISDEEFAANPLAHRDVIKDLVSRYNATIAILKERQLAQSKLDFYLQGIASEVYNSCDRKERESLSQSVSLSDQVDALKSRFWNTVFIKTKLGDRTTSHFQKKFDSFASEQASMAFTEANIHEVLGMFFLNQNEIMQECLVEVFDKLSSYHADNKIHTEGWKSNKSWRLNKKIVHPWGISYDASWGFRSRWSDTSIYTDLDKVLCYLSGTDTSKGVTTSTAIEKFTDMTRDGSVDYRQEFESYFFNIKIFKKGTVHLKFKDLTLLADFNRKAAEGKNWLGDGS